MSASASQPPFGDFQNTNDLNPFPAQAAGQENSVQPQEKISDLYLAALAVRYTQTFGAIAEGHYTDF